MRDQAGHRLPCPQEEAVRAQQEAARADREAAARQALELRVEETASELARLRALLARRDQ